ncbi:MAG: DNA primase [Phycisphaerae bacterium]
MALSFDQSTISRVQQASDIVELVGEHLSLAKKGREMVGMCPFHDDHRPSLYVNPGKQIFKCFACGAGGDVFKFLQMRENLTFPQAVERLANRAGIEIKALRHRVEKQKPDIDPNRLAKVNAWADKYFQKNFYDSKGTEAREYLLKRHITLETAKQWHIGYSASGANDLVQAARAAKVPDELLKASGLAAADFTDKFINRLMFAITDVTGRVIGFGGRTMDGTGAKYINSPTSSLFDKSNCLYGLEQARHHIVSSGTAVVTEGYTDCIMAHQCGFKNVVATLGTSFTEGHGRMLKRYAQNVILLFDNDTAGLAAANRALDICLSLQIDIKIATIGQEKDPCDFLVEVGKEKFAYILENALDIFQFKYDRLIQNYEGQQTIAGKKAAIEEFIQAIVTAILSGKLGAIEQGILINRLAKTTGIDKSQINSELQNKIKAARRNSTYKIGASKVLNADLGQGVFAAAQKEIIEVLINKPELFKKIKSKITPEQFDVPILKLAAQAVFDTICESPKASIADILSHVESVDLGNTLTELSETGQQKGNFETRLGDAIEIFLKSASKTDIKQDQKKYLEKISESAKKRNPHSIGMV